MVGSWFLVLGSGSQHQRSGRRKAQQPADRAPRAIHRVALQRIAQRKEKDDRRTFGYDSTTLGGAARVTVAETCEPG